MPVSPYPIAAFFFEVEIEDVGKISFQEVSGLDESVEILEYRVGRSPVLMTQKRAGMRKSSTVKMQRGIFRDKTEVEDLFSNLQKKFYHPNQESLLNVTITLLDEVGEIVMAWKLKNAFPTKITGPSLNSENNSAAIEALEFAHEGIEVESF
ncbi:MAG: phage tail protein [Bacteroidota bacterium]